MKRLVGILRVLLFTGAGILLLWLTFRHQSFNEVFKKLRDANPFYIGLSVVLGIFALISRTLRWQQLIEPLGYKTRTWSTFHALLVGYLANLAIPRLGEISRCGALSRADNIPFDKLLGTVIVERVSDVLMLLISMLLVALLEMDRLGGFLNKTFLEPIEAKMANSQGLIWIMAIVSLAVIVLMIRWFTQDNPPAFIKKFRTLIKGVLEGLTTIARLKNPWLFVFHSLFIWIMYWLTTFVCFFALSSTASLTGSAGLFLMVLGGLGMTAPVQGGIGTYHLLVSQGLMLYGLTQTDGIVFATLVHTTQTLMVVVLGLISMIALFFVVKPIKAKE